MATTELSATISAPLGMHYDPFDHTVDSRDSAGDVTAARPSLPQAALRTLALLVIGEPRATIARTLHVSPRTVDTYVTSVKAALNTQQWFCLGVRSVRLHLVPRTEIIARAMVDFQPTPSRRSVLDLAADGFSVGEIATKLGITSRTVSYHLTGARNACSMPTLVATGAFLEAAGWFTAT
jgi:DNA-binding NarL/FixJ family response regulator